MDDVINVTIPIFRLKRDARRLARDRGVPLHAALDLVARQAGFAHWSLLAADHARQRPAARVLQQMQAGDLVLLGARPGQGKTLLGLELCGAALAAGRGAAFFSLEWTAAEVARRFAEVGVDVAQAQALRVDTSDALCADHIIAALGDAPRGSVAVVDYLQILDQDRRLPPLGAQMAALADFARRSGVIVVLIAQIDRGFADEAGPPDWGDVRLPNPVNLDLFDRAVFLQDGAVRVVARK
ncbi:DNA helicase [uncultured Pseudosulfitobacter sp.]|uniref:DNA helicase n=1 Tax=uncultured Pseudosulfitobacter sp. TaxID=2854214 RepID=UPI0030DBDAE3|tara:strand:+ start:16119 stop:16838 length:720 start_codon:yes stop_codon:yes gene_type:complete